MPALVHVKDLLLTAPHKVLCDKISFSMSTGEKIALVAQNGSGKSTLLRALVGKREDEGGTIQRTEGVRVGYLSQHETFDPNDLVRDALFLHKSERGEAIRAYETALENGSDNLPELVQRIEELRARDYETLVRIVIDKLDLHELLEQTVGSCSGGELKRLALARLLIDDPDVLLLDEPTNHLDIDMIEWLEGYLHRSTRAIILVTHDRYVLSRLCTRILELDQGRLFSYPGNYQKYLELKEKREATEAFHLHQMKQLVRKECERMNKAPRARETKSVKREKDFYTLTDSYTNKKQYAKKKSQRIEIGLEKRRVGGKIVKIEHLCKAYGEKTILDRFSYEFRAGERVGLLGKNGAGKSTLLRLLMGEEQPDSGHIWQGETIHLAMYQQKQPQYDESKRLIDIVKDVAEYISIGSGKRLSASQLLERFLFSPKQQHQRVHTLSGGERRRLHLLTILISNPNFLILDEPTNDLDIETLRVLEEFLEAYTGCLVVVSHDRFFMDRVVDHLLVFAGDGVINEFPGSYSDWKSFQEQKEDTDEDDQQEDEDNDVDSDTEVSKQRSSSSLTNKDRQELKLLEKRLEENEQRKDEVNTLLMQGDLDHDQLQQLSDEFAQLISQIHQDEERWLELQER